MGTVSTLRPQISAELNYLDVLREITAVRIGALGCDFNYQTANGVLKKF